MDKSGCLFSVRLSLARFVFRAQVQRPLDQGSREFLRPNPMGTFDGDIPLLATDSAYSKHTLLRAIARESS